MSQFRSYPIHIVYSKNSQDTADYQAAGFYIAGDEYMGDWMKTTGKALRQIVSDSAPAHTHDRLLYESAIKRGLEKICGTPLGLWVLDSLHRGTRYWILPDPNLFCTAVAYPAKSPKEGGGIRIHINIEDWGDALDDTLLHELAHAMRFSHNTHDPRPLDDQFPTSEEFLGTQFSNVHRSFLNQTRFYHRYDAQYPTASKGAIYSSFVERPMQIMALKFCLDTEPLATRLARLPAYHPDFNPFRDYPTLERMVRGKMQIPGAPAPDLMRL